MGHLDGRASWHPRTMATAFAGTRTGGGHAAPWFAGECVDPDPDARVWWRRTPELRARPHSHALSGGMPS